jgi:hypothetical protein
MPSLEEKNLLKARRGHSLNFILFAVAAVVTGFVSCVATVSVFKTDKLTASDLYVFLFFIGCTIFFAALAIVSFVAMRNNWSNTKQEDAIARLFDFIARLIRLAVLSH